MMRHFTKTTLFFLTFIGAVLSEASTAVVAAEFVPSPAQPSPFGQLFDFLVRQQATLLPALAFASGFALIAGVAHNALSDFSRVPIGDWVWRWTLKAVFIVSVFAIGAFVFHSQSKVIDATTGLSLPEPACKPPRESATTAIVLLHGWNGSADATWNSFPELICEDQTLSDTELFVVDYPTFLARRQLSIAELGRWLRQSFFTDTLRKYSDVHVIAHSMGGPMARNMYLEDELAGESKIRSIITIASPFLGAQIAELARALDISADLTNDMAPGSAFLKALANNWTDVRLKPATYCFTSPQDEIVPSDSAKNQCDCTHDYPQWGHVDMVKPMLATDERYRMPIRALRNIRAAAQMDASVRARCFGLADTDAPMQHAFR
jgi:pimeloyl-ACP methyl ester carboxylesterase